MGKRAPLSLADLSLTLSHSHSHSHSVTGSYFPLSPFGSSSGFSGFYANVQFYLCSFYLYNINFISFALLSFRLGFALLGVWLGKGDRGLSRSLAALSRDATRGMLLSPANLE